MVLSRDGLEAAHQHASSDSLTGFKGPVPGVGLVSSTYPVLDGQGERKGHPFDHGTEFELSFQDIILVSTRMLSIFKAIFSQQHAAQGVFQMSWQCAQIKEL